MEESKKLSRSMSIVIGGVFAAVMAEIPIINMFSFILFFIGGALAVYHYFNKFGDPGTMASAHIGSFAGFVGGGLSFMVLSTIKMSLMSDVEIQQLVDSMVKLFSTIDPEAEVTEEFVRVNVLSKMWIARLFGMFYAVVTGALGGLASRLYFRKKKVDIEA